MDREVITNLVRKRYRNTSANGDQLKLLIVFYLSNKVQYKMCDPLIKY